MPLTTILVEDSQTIRENLIPALEELAGVHIVACAETAQEAIAAFARHASWQLAIVDLFLKEGSGLTVLRACEGRREDQHAVVLTNYLTDEMRRRCLALGADAAFDKSTELDAFFAHCLRYQAG
ncbi:DNA-binding NarL/FixJ family response regulator [Variovorax sp. TBS-050B]|uniref:response regulator n=1 Tax=Variovorax sp. TBS-050B TaxID=2940551 RepID=UPI0024738A01|nr:response regulator [Variovorax sp. TBS-050B]MDH6590568.1 DNA-binding NarL/FixJ family response regulator [Variovorax sp. TBS-050B]